MSKKLLFIPAAGALAGVHIDHLLLASNAQRPEIQHLVSQGQIVSADFPLLTDGQTDNCQQRIVQYQGSPPYALVTSTRKLHLHYGDFAWENFDMADKTIGKLKTVLRVNKASAKVFEPRTS